MNAQGKKNQVKRSLIIERFVIKQYDSEDMVSSATDLFTDLRHFCDIHKVDLADAQRISYQHYLAEKNGEPI